MNAPPQPAPIAEGVAGLVAAPLFLVAFGMFGGPPTPREAADQIVPYLTEHRTQIFVSSVLIGIGSCFYGWYLAGLRRFVSADDRGSLGTAALLGGLLGVVVVLVGVSLLGGAVVHVPDLPIALVAFDMYNALVTVGGFGFGFSVVLAAAAARRNAVLAHRLCVAGIVIGAVQLATIPGLWVETGPFAPLGPVAIVAFVLLTGWYGVVAWAMVRTSP